LKNGIYVYPFTGSGLLVIALAQGEAGKPASCRGLVGPGENGPGKPPFADQVIPGNCVTHSKKCLQNVSIFKKKVVKDHKTL
jgi:hypothetical protein